jgi:hypothetical protein
MPIPPQAIAAAAWGWDKYGKALTDKAADKIKGRWDKFRWSEAAEKYRAKIKKLYGTMQIMGMAEPVPLDDIFADAYMLDKPTAFGRFDIDRLKQLSADPEAPPPQAKRVNGLRLVREKGNLFILGKPGAGKTTFLKYIALQSAEQNINKVPIFVSLKQWSDSGLELLPFITERFDICDFPSAQPFVEELLKSGNAIVLFDGLDEVNQEGGQRDKQTRAMNNFIEKYDKAQSLITCRVAASDYSFKPFTYVEIADFTQHQIEKFVRNWFRNQEGEQDEETSKRFLTEFAKEDNKGLRDLARTPLLLTLLCLSFNETLTFPQRRAEIYQEALDALLKKWDSSRRIKRDEVYRKLSLGHKENMLARIAAETFEKKEYFIPQIELERLISNYIKNVPPHDTGEATDGEIILKAIEAQHGIFVERARGVYSFSHLTFQEYLTAKYIVANAEKGTLKSLVKEHCTDNRWREVYLLTTSLLPDASPFIKTFRRGIHELLGNDEKLLALLIWVDKKSSSTRRERPLTQSRYRYLYMVASLLFVAENRLHGEPYADGYASAIESIEDHGLALDILLGCSLINPSILGRAIEMACSLGLNEFAKELATLSTPGNDAGGTKQREFQHKLRALMIKHRDFGHEWGLTETQRDQLSDYLNATNLFGTCLELAFMPPEEKEAVLDSLFLPPGRAGGA